MNEKDGRQEPLEKRGLFPERWGGWWKTLLVTLLLVHALPAAATPPSSTLEVLPWDRAMSAAPGSWVEYALLVGGYPVGPYLRFLVVGDEETGEEAGSWVELWISQRPGSATQAYRLLIGRDSLGRAGVRRSFVRLLGGEIREIDPQELLAPSGPRGSGAAERPPQARWKGAAATTTAILTRAGSFTARELILDDGGVTTKAWFSDRVPLFGLVRLELAGQLGLELHGHGVDGVSVMAEVASMPRQAKEAGENQGSKPD